MKLSLSLAVMVTVVAATNLLPGKTAQASSFGEQEVNRGQFAVVAAPYRHGYNLLVVEQIPGQRKCWNEIGANPTVVEPLFLNFDFTNACIRSSDSNNYSIRFNGKDYGMDYLLNIVKRDRELHLVGTPRDPNQPELHMGRTHGFKSGSLKIILNPGWRLTKRTYEGSPTEHIYLSNTPNKKEQLVSYTPEPVANPVDSQPTNYAPQPVATPVYPQPNNYAPQPVATPVYPLYYQPNNYAP